MTRLVQRLESALKRREAGWLLLAAVAAAYAIAYFRHPLFPGSGTGAIGRGWWTWTDQQRYLVEAAAIAQGTLASDTYHYPVGYPALGALFWRWLPANPFFVPDLLLVLAACAAWWALAVRWLSRIEAVVVALLFIATHRWLINYTMVVPWNTLATQAALLTGIWWITAERGAKVWWRLSALAAATYLVRPIDAVAFFPLLSIAALRLLAETSRKTWRAPLLHGLGGIALLGASVGFAAWLNLRIFGSWRSPYEVVSTETIGFFSYPISYKFHWLFVDGQPLFGETEPALLFRYAWLVLALPGVIFWLRRERWTAAAGAAALGLNWLLYVNYNDLLPSDLYRFTLIHYLAWGFPLLFVLAAAALVRGWRDRWVRAGGIAAVLVFAGCTGLRMDEQPIECTREAGGGWTVPPERPLLIRFPGAEMEKVTDVRLDGRVLVEYSDYLVPYVPSDLKLLLGTRTAGARLTVAPGSELADARPEIGRYVWRWRWTPVRLRRIFD